MPGAQIKNPRNPVREAAFDAWRPRDMRHPWQWGDVHVMAEPGSPMPGPWRSSNSPWLRKPLEKWGDNSIRDLVVYCSAQTSKTTLGQVAIEWSISEDPGRALWVTHDADMAREDVRDRHIPMFRACKPVARLILKEHPDQIVFRTMPLYFGGSYSLGKLQSKPIRWLIMDEARNYPPGALPTVLKRTRAFWNSRRMILTTPGKFEDETHRAFLEGTQEEYNLRCPACGILYPPRFEDLRGAHPDSGEICDFREIPGFVREDGSRNLAMLESVIRYVCPGCRTAHQDTPTVRKSMARGGEYVVGNPSAPAKSVSFTWSAFVAPWVAWADIAAEYFRAIAALKAGDEEPMRTFVTETLGKPWQEELAEIDDYGFLEDRRDEYETGDPWGDEKFRFMAADRGAKDGEHYWWVVRAFSSSGTSRLIAYGKAKTKEELEEKRREHDVPAKNCILDSGFSATDCYKWSLGTGWKVAKGEPDEWFTISEVGPDGKRRTVRRSWDRSIVDANLGKKGNVRRLLRLWRWSNPRFFDLLGNLMTGTIPGWTIPRRTERVYLQHLSSWVREELKDTLGRPKLIWRKKWADHLRDCELQILVMAVACRLIRSGTATAKVSVPPKDDDPSGLRADLQTSGG